MAYEQPLGSADHTPVVVDIGKGTVSGWLQLSLSDGSFYILPPEVLQANGWDQPGTPVPIEHASQLQHAAWHKRVLHKATDSLARAEQCRARLEQKLVAKGLPATIVAEVLDDLQQRNLLSDRRYAELWAKNRMLRRGEGPTAVQLGLRSRGVAADTARDAVNELLQEYPDVLQRALERAAARLSRTRAGRDCSTLRYRLVREGFAPDLVDAEVKKYQI